MRRAVICHAALAMLAATANAFARRAPGRIEGAEIARESGVRGGLVVHVGCGDGASTAGLRVDESFVVHGLDTDPANVKAARARVRAEGLAMSVSIDAYSGDRLPFIDGLASLIVVSDPARVAFDEVRRVLCPGGVAHYVGDRSRRKYVKPRPADIDDWPQYLHGADGCQVLRDARVGPPRHMQWAAGPLWDRHHDFLHSVATMVTKGRRIFYFVDEGATSIHDLPPRWALVARDAFNGVALWKVPAKGGNVTSSNYASTLAPINQLHRLLVAGEEVVYASLGVNAPVGELDAATGRLLRTFGGTAGAEEIVLHGRRLLVVRGFIDGKPASVPSIRERKRRRMGLHPNRKTVEAFDLATGRALWQWRDSAEAPLVPLTVAASGGRAFLVAGTTLSSLDVESGKEVWSSPGLPQMKTPRVNWLAGALAVREGKVLVVMAGRMCTFDADTGRKLWTVRAPGSIGPPIIIVIVDGLVWLGNKFDRGYDLGTGDIVKTSDVWRTLWTSGHHQRCYLTCPQARRRQTW